LDAGSVTVTTHGNDVLVSASGNAIVFADFVGYRILRDGATHLCGAIPDGYLISGLQSYWNFSISGLDITPAAGSHTYTLQFYVSDVATSNQISEGYLQVAEINE
jgi:hypothetical protein